MQNQSLHRFSSSPNKKKTRMALRTLLMGCLLPLPAMAQQVIPTQDNAINRKVANEGVVSGYQSRLTPEQIQAIEARYPADVLGCNVCRQRLGLPLLPENSPLVLSSSHNAQPANAIPPQAGPMNLQAPMSGVPRTIGGYLDSYPVQESAPLRSLTPNANAAMQRAAQQRLQSQTLQSQTLQSQSLQPNPVPQPSGQKPQPQTLPPPIPPAAVQSSNSLGTAVPLDSLPPEIRRQIQGTLEIPNGGRLLKPGESIPSPISTAPSGSTQLSPPSNQQLAPSSNPSTAVQEAILAPQSIPAAPSPVLEKVEELPKRAEAPELSLPPPAPVIKPVSIEIPFSESDEPKKEADSPVITVHVTTDGKELSKTSNHDDSAQLERVQAILGQHQMQIAELKETMNRLLQREAPRDREPNRNPDMERHIDRQAQEIRELQGQLEKMRDLERDNRNLREKLEHVRGELRGIDDSKEQLEQQKLKLSEGKRQLLDERKKLEQDRREFEANRPKLRPPVERKIEQVPPRPNVKEMKPKELKPKKSKKDSGKETSDQRINA